MNKQQRTEYIEQCERKVRDQHAAYIRATLEHEHEIRRIALEAQVEAVLLTMNALARSRGTAKKITVAM